MSTKRGKIDIHPSSQLTIFDMVVSNRAPTPGSFNIDKQLRQALSDGLKQCSFSRYEAAAKMSELVGDEITKTMLDAWTAESKEQHRFPAEHLPAFCQVTGCMEPLRIMASLVKCHLVESEEAFLVELARIDQARRDLARREKTIREYLAKTTGR